MARKKKVGFDTLELTTDFLSDSDVVKIHQNIGAYGIVILLSIYLQAFKRQGYYLPVNDLTLGIVCANSLSTLDAVNSIIEKMLDMGIFHRGLYESHGILTSAKLQELYIVHSKTVKRRVDIAPEYSLVDTDGVSSGNETITDDELLELSRSIVKNWNVLHKDNEWERKRVPEDLITMPEFLEALQAIAKKYDDAANIATWIDLERVAFNRYPHLVLGQIVGDIPTFTMLYNARGQRDEPIPDIPTPVEKKEEPVTEPVTEEISTIEDNEGNDDLEDNISGCEPVDNIGGCFSADTVMCGPCSSISTMEMQTPRVESVVVTNASTAEAEADELVMTRPVAPAVTQPEDEELEDPLADHVDIPPHQNVPSPSPSPETPFGSQKRFGGFFAGRNDDIRDTDGTPIESPEDKRMRETAQREREAQARIDAEFENEDDNYEIVGEDPELSPLIRSVARLFNEKYGAQNYPKAEEYHVDADLFAQEKTAQEYFRAYIEYDERCRDVGFWDLMIDGMIYLHKMRGIGDPENPKLLFDVNTDLEDLYGNTGLIPRIKCLEIYSDYVTKPERCWDYTARETGRQFLEMREKRKQIEEEERKAELEKSPAASDAGEGEADGDRETPDGDIAGNVAVSSVDLEWLKRREEHPELFKDPTKEFGDRTGTAPWALKNPPSADEVLKDPDYLAGFEHGTSIRSLA